MRRSGLRVSRRPHNRFRDDEREQSEREVNDDDRNRPTNDLNGAQFMDQDTIVAPTLPTLNLTAEQVLTAGRSTHYKIDRPFGLV
jgi:hypothetical protein